MWDGNRPDYDALYAAHLEWRNMPWEDGLSPAQWMSGFKQRTMLPALENTFQHITPDQYELAEERCRQHAAQDRARLSEHSRDLPPLGVGTTARIQDTSSGLWDSIGAIVGICDEHSQRSYLILRGHLVIVRNWTHLRPWWADLGDGVKDLLADRRARCPDLRLYLCD